MQDEKKTKRRLIAELKDLRHRIGDVHTGGPEERRATPESPPSGNTYLMAAMGITRGDWANTEPVISAFGDGVSIQDKHYIIVYQNGVLRKRFGDRTGEYCYKAYENADHVCDGCPLAMTIKDGLIHSSCKTVTSGNGPMTVEIRSTPLLDGKGRIIAAAEVIRDVTERVNTEAALRESEAKFKGLAEKSPNMIFIYDHSENRLVYTNRKFSELTGYNSEELCSPSFDFRSLLSAESRQSAVRVLAKQAGGRTVPPGEYTFISRKGKKIEGIIALENISYGGKKAVIGVVTDITDHKKTKNELERRLKLERTISNISGRFVTMGNINKAIERSLEDIGHFSGACRAHLFQFDEDGGIMDNTHQWCAPAVPSSKEYLQGLAVRDFTWWTDRIKNDEEININDISTIPKSARKARKIMKSLGIRSILGVPLYSRGIIKGFMAIENANGQSEGLEEKILLMRVSSDIIGSILERFRADEKMNRMMDAVSACTDGIALSDENDRYIYVNEAYAKLHGYKQSELIGKSWRDLIPPEMVKPSEDIITGTLHNRKKGSFTGELFSMRKDGSLVPTEIKAKALWNDSGGYRGHLCVVTDITDRRNNEEQLREAKIKLEKQNQELKKLDRVKDSLIRDVSHELKTPVAKLAMQVELLRNMIAGEYVPKDASRIFDLIESSIRRQQSVINNILNLKKLEAGGRKYKMVDFRLDNLLKEVIEESRFTFESQGIRLEIDLKPVIIRSDKEMLWHSFSNIINNAAKFVAMAAHPEITIRCTLDDKSALVTVADNGIGLGRTEIPRVFEKFFKATPALQGSGVGLNISKRILDDLGGFISIESPGRGKGTTVSVRLPAATRPK